MTINFSAQPYYDDFSEDKNFHKILFKPGYAVQARELTQTQTILQDQISKLGKFVLSDGSRVSGARIFSDNNVRVVQLQKNDETTSNILDFEGLYVVSSTTRLMGIIVDVDYTNLILTIKPLNISPTNNFAAGETLNIFSEKYLAFARTINPDIAADYTCFVDVDSSFTVQNASSTKYSLNVTVNTLSLQVGDIISNALLPTTYTIVDIVDGTTCTVDKAFDASFTNISLTITRLASRKSLQISIDSGVFFTNGYFVKNLAQSIVPNNKTEYPSAVIGFEVNETVQDFVDDESLLDPALGSYNYSAPGADRYVISLTLVTKPLVDNVIQDLTTTKFIELVRVRKGVIIKSNLNPTLGELEKTLARQMYDHAGNFFVKPFTLSFNENQLLNSQNTLPLEISSGKAYVFGHELDIQYPFYISTDKARDYASTLNYDMATYYGNSIRIKDLYGSLNFQSAPTIELHSTTINQSYSTKIGTALTRNFKYNTTNDYNLYLYEIKLNKSADISNVKSVVITTTANNYSAYNFKANTIQVANVTTLTDSNFQSLVFNLPHNNIKSISNVDFESNLLGTYTFTSNATSIFSGSLSTQILGGSGVVSSAIKKQYFYVTAKQTNGYYTAGSSIDTDDLIINISQTGSEYVATFTTTNGKPYNGTADIWYTVQYTNASPKLKTLVENEIACITLTNYKNPVSLGVSDIYAVKGVYKLNSNSSMYKGAWNSANTYYIGSYVTSNNSIYYATNGNTNQPPATSNSWLQLSPSVVDYKINSGQNPSYYDHGTFTVSSNSNIGTYILIFDYFTHGSGGYLSQASYPVSVDYKDIPSFIGDNGNAIQLRDSIDFRPRRQNYSSTLTFDSFNVPATTFSGFMLSYDYYLSRIDKFVVTDNKDFKIIKGTPKYNNIVPPSTPQNAMLLATLHYNAYGFSKDDIKIVYENHRRYTMDDIGVLDKRINRVEYYTTLSLAESDAINKSTSDELLKSRLRNGFLVDSFSSLTVADLTNLQYNCAIDLQEEVCRPAVQSNAIKPKYQISELDFGQYITNKLLHFPYSIKSTDSIVASNKKATGSINCNPFDVISFAGTLSISPQVDSWFEVNELPDINVVSEDLDALNQALGNPALVYDSWNLYNSQNNTQQDNSSQTVVRQSGDYTYNIGVGTAKQSKIVEDIRKNVIAYARSIPITLDAHSLSPYTKMYVFVNGHLMNGYVQYGVNTTGQITGIKIENSGINYLSNTTISIISGTNSSANASANVTSNGQIIDIELTKLGVNYTNISNTNVIIAGAGTGAKANVTLLTRNGNDLITDSTGSLNCTLYLPCNDDIKFRTGEILISISDDPINPKQGSSFAEAIFTSSGDLKILQETITSIRKPYIRKDYTPTYVPTYTPTYTPSTGDTGGSTVEYKSFTKTYEDDFIPTVYTQDTTTTLNSFTGYEWTLKQNRNLAGDYTSSASFTRNANGGGSFNDTKPVGFKVLADNNGAVDMSFRMNDIVNSSGGKTTITFPASMIPGNVLDMSTLALSFDKNGYGGSSYAQTNPRIFGEPIFNKTTGLWSVVVAQSENDKLDMEGFTVHLRLQSSVNTQDPNNYLINQVGYTGTNGVKDQNSKTILQSNIPLSSLPNDTQNLIGGSATGATSLTMSTTGSYTTTQTSTTPFITSTTASTVDNIASQNNAKATASSSGTSSITPTASNVTTPATNNPTSTPPPTAVSAATYNNAINTAVNYNALTKISQNQTKLLNTSLTTIITNAQPSTTAKNAISNFTSIAGSSTSVKSINAATSSAVSAIKADKTLTAKEKTQLTQQVVKIATAEKKENAREAAAAKAAAKVSSLTIKPAATPAAKTTGRR